MSVTVHAYGNVDALHGIFNAVAMVMNSGDFEAMIRVGVVIGFIVVATLAAFPGNLQKGFNWFIAVAVISGALLIPKTEVAIEDRLGIQATVVVDNVPWSLAMLASVKSSIGFTLTELAETAFQTIPSADRALPAELSYLQTGVMFGSRMVEATRNAMPASLYDQKDLVMYIRNCVLPEQGRAETPDAYARTTDLRAMMGDSNPALPSAYHDPSNNWRVVVAPCPDVWTALQGRLDAAGTAAVVKAARQMSPEKYAANPGAAIADATSAIPTVYAKAALASAASTASQVMLQNILINATADAAAADAAATGDTETLMLAMMRAQAVGTMNAGNTVQGKIAEQALPLIRNSTEAILYALFPVLCVILVASETRAMGSLFKSYIYVLLWVELWPPMFAIVNYLQTLASVKELAAAAHMPAATGLSISTASSIYSTAVSSTATAAWFITFVPLIAAALLWGFDKMLAVTGAMGGGVRAAQGEAATATVKGNVALGNVSMDRHQIDAYRTSPSMMTSVSVGGTQVDDVLSGQRVSSYASSQHLSSIGTLASVGQAVAQSARNSTTAAERSTVQADAALGAAFGHIRSAIAAAGKGKDYGLGFDISQTNASGVTEREQRTQAERLAKTYGISDVDQVQRALSFAVGLDIPRAIQALSPISAGFNASGQSSNAEMLKRDVLSGAESLRQLGIERQRQTVDQWQRSERFSDVKRESHEAREAVDANLRKERTYRESASNELGRAKELGAQWQAVQDFALSNRTEWGNLVEKEFQRRGMTVQDGVADPRVHAQVVRDLVAQGSFRSDGPGGSLMFLPIPQGIGPSETTLASALAVRDGGSAALEAAHQSAAPMGGASGVTAQHAQHVAKVQARERQYGVTPTDSGAAAAGAPVAESVGAAAKETRAALDTTGAAIRSDAADAQQAVLDRQRDLSAYYQPGASKRLDPNPAPSLANSAGAKAEPPVAPPAARAEIPVDPRLQAPPKR